MYISIQLCILVHGCYIGLKSDFIVWVLKEMELVAEDEADLSRKLFAAIFNEQLENRPNDVCCTEADGKNCLTSNIAGHSMYVYGVQQNLYSLV